MNVRGGGDVLEIRKIAPALRPPHAPQFLDGLGRGRNVVRMNRFAIQLGGEREQHLGHLAARLEPVCARAVIPLLETLQFELQPQHLDAEFLGALVLFLRALRLPVALQNQRTHHRLQRVAVLW